MKHTSEHVCTNVDGNKRGDTNGHRDSGSLLEIDNFTSY